MHRAPNRWQIVTALVVISLVTSIKMIGPIVAQAGGRDRSRDPGVTTERINKAFKLKASRVSNLRINAPAGRPFQVVVPLEGEAVTLELEPGSVRGSKYRVLVQQADGSLAQAPPGRERNYRGRVREIEDSSVAATLDDDGLSARILLPDGREYWVEPAATKVPEAQADTHVVYESADVEGGQACATDPDRHFDPESFAEAARLPLAVACGTGLCLTELAGDTDVEFYNAYGSVSAVENRINSIVNAVNIQYERDVDITHQITTIVVRTVEPDPYTSTAPETLLNQFRTHWQNNHGGIQRDTAHLFSGKNLDGSTIGIAWLNAVCGSYGYGVAQSNFTSNFAYVTDLSAHELGHNWGAGHCSCPSYTMNPSITGANIFDPADSIPDIQSFRDSRTCLAGVSGCADQSDCDDGSVCTGAEDCVAGSCQPGTPLNCNDANACTADSCNPATGCAHNPVNCNDGTTCTTDSCNPATGCVHTPLNCNDANACTTDSCNAASGCLHTPLNCNDGTACTTDSCNPATGCVHTPLNCNDANACTTDSCNAASGCAHTAVNCADSNPCTTDSCTPASGCQHLPITCPAGQQCSGGSCVPLVCNNDGTCNGQEDCDNCPADCPGADGATCGNAVCEPASGEDCLSCAADCRGKQGGNPSQRFCCGDGAGQNPVGCSDPRCTAAEWDCTNEPAVAFCCGDGACDPGEDSCTCDTDCGSAFAVETDCIDGMDDDCDGAADCQDPDCADQPACLCNSNGLCELGEDCDNCPDDCFTGGAVCGNNVCETADGEDCLSCAGDCNGKQGGKPSQRFCCGDGAGQSPVGCSDPRCTASGNSCSSVPGVSSCCGDGVCEGVETVTNCDVDCP